MNHYPRPYPLTGLPARPPAARFGGILSFTPAVTSRKMMNHPRARRRPPPRYLQ